MHLGVLDLDILRGDSDLFRTADLDLERLERMTEDLDLERLERMSEEDLLRRLLPRDLDLESPILFRRDLDLRRITMDLERVRFFLLTDLERDLRVRYTGDLLRERDRERLPLRTDLDRDLDRFFLRGGDCFNLDPERRALTGDLDRRPRRGDLVRDLLVRVRGLESERRALLPERDLDLRLVTLADLDRDLRLSNGDGDLLFWDLFLFETETDLSLDSDLSLQRLDFFGVFERLRLSLLRLSLERDLNFGPDSLSLFLFSS